MQTPLDIDPIVTPQSLPLPVRTMRQRDLGHAQGEVMRELDPDTWLMIGITWFHGLLCGWAIWREGKKSKEEE